jgi:hypothetical protein
MNGFPSFPAWLVVLTIAAPAPRNHARHEGAAGVEGAVEIDADGLAPVLVGQFRERRDAGRMSGAVEQDVEPAPSRQQRLGGSRHLAPVGDVDRGDMDLAERFELAFGLFQLGLITAPKLHRGTRLQIELRRGEADAGASAGHQRALGLQVVDVHVGPCWRR